MPWGFASPGGGWSNNGPGRAAVLHKQQHKVHSKNDADDGSEGDNDVPGLTRPRHLQKDTKDIKDTVNFTSSNSSVKKGETLVDTLRNIEAMKIDIVVVRHKGTGVPKFLADNSNAIIVNAGDGAHEHPTQALLDMLTVEEKLGTLEGKNVTIIGDIRHSRVARSNLWGMTTMGAHVTLCGPSTLVPRNTELMDQVTWEPDVQKAVANADAIIALRLQKERMDDALLPSMREYRNTFGITQELLDCAKESALTAKAVGSDTSRSENSIYCRLPFSCPLTFSG